jgi:hypothetical protein
LVAITLLDVMCVLELAFELRWALALGWVLFAWPLLLTVRGRAVLGIGLLWMLAILPQVRWNYIKSFYVDARRLEPGMGEVEVREIMAPYLEVGRMYQPTAEEREYWVTLHSGMLFIHSPEGWTDHCEVELDGLRRARAIHIEKD